MPVDAFTNPRAVYLVDATGAAVGTANRLPVAATGGGSGTSATTDGNGDLRVQTVTITQTTVALTANTSTQLVAANTARIGLEIQTDGTAIVGIGRQGATLTSAAGAGLVIPAGSYPLYTMPYATKTAVTGYTATAQTVRVTEYSQQG